MGWGKEMRVLASSARYVGVRHQCPICGWRLREFATSDTGVVNSVCPYCWSSERHRLLWLYLTREFKPAGRVLHFAPERGIARQLARREGVEYVTVDLAPGRAMMTADLVELPFTDQQFDLVLCSHVLEHVPDDRRAMREIRRVLRPGGHAILQHPIDEGREQTFEDWSKTTPEERDAAFYQFDHVRIYGRDFAERLAESGLSAELVRYADRVPESERERFRLVQAPSATPARDIEADVIYACSISA
jgi:SAM-dependent methyltransferase